MDHLNRTEKTILQDVREQNQENLEEKEIKNQIF
jgi:hypothetical protein